jgi:hypothetical protein
MGTASRKGAAPFKSFLRPRSYNHPHCTVRTKVVVWVAPDDVPATVIV